MLGKKKKNKMVEPIAMTPTTFAETLLQAKANANKAMNEVLTLKNTIEALKKENTTLKNKIDRMKAILKEITND